MKFGEERLVATLRSIRWDDLGHCAEVLPPLLEELADSPGWIADAMTNLVYDQHLRTLSERLAELDKLVLLDDGPSGCRVRVHVFRQGYFDRPHNHRFSFGTRILSNGYMHTVYGDYQEATPDIDPKSLTPKLVKREVAGTGYVIGHTLIHSVAAEPDTVTITVRGPSQKDRMLIVDPASNEAWWVFGMKDERQEEILVRRLDDARIEDVRDLMRAQGIIG